jgi:hypothetical protein
MDTIIGGPLSTILAWPSWNIKTSVSWSRGGNYKYFDLTSRSVFVTVSNPNRLSPTGALILPVLGQIFCERWILVRFHHTFHGAKF